MRYTYTGKVYEENGVLKAEFRMWEEKGLLFKKRIDHGEVQLYQGDLPMRYEQCINNRGGGYYGPEPADADEFQKAIRALKTC